MIVALRIYGSPTRQFYRDPVYLSLLDLSKAAHQLLVSVGQIQSSISGETSNIDIVLNNTAAQVSRYYQLPPIGLPADLIDEKGSVVFAGSVAQMQFTLSQMTVNLAK